MLLAFSVGCVGFFAAPLARTRTSTLHVTMLDPDATRDSSPKQSFDNDMSGWRPDQGVKEIPEGKALHAGNFESTVRHRIRDPGAEMLTGGRRPALPAGHAGLLPR